MENVLATSCGIFSDKIGDVSLLKGKEEKGYLLDLPPPQATVAFDNDHFWLTLWGSGSHQYYSQEHIELNWATKKTLITFH